MRPSRPLALRRALARRALLTTLALVVAAAVALPLLLFGLADSASARGAAAVLAAQPARAASLVVAQQLDDDASAQRRSVAAALAARLPTGSTSVTWSASATTAVEVGGTGREARIVAAPDLPSVARTVQGTWPDLRTATGSGAVPTAVQADAARRLGLRVGDTLAVPSATGATALRVVATWRATDPGAARWAGASDVGSGVDAGAAGPLVVPADAIGTVAGSARSTWTVVPRTGGGALPDPDGLRAGLRAVDAATGADSGALAGADLTGTLGDTLVRLGSAVATARALVGIAVALGAVVAATAVGVLLGRLRDARTGETTLLTARGASRAQLVRWAAAEAGVVALVAALVGAALAVAGSAAAGAAPGALACVLAVLGAVVVTVGASVLTTSRAPVTAGRTGARTTVVLTGLLVAGAAFATWRLFTVGVVGRAAGGRLTVDPVSAVAPVLTVLAAGLVTVLLVGALAGVSARGVGRRRGLVAALVVRTLARGWSSTAPVVVLVATAVAVGGLVVGLQDTTVRTDRATADVLVGPAVRVTTDGDDAVGVGTHETVPDAGPRATAVTPVLVDEASTGDQRVPFVALPSGAAARVLGSDGAAVARPTAGSGRAGTVLPAGTERVAVSVAVGPATLAGAAAPQAVGVVRSVLWVSDADGVAVQLPLLASGGSSDGGASDGGSSDGGSSAEGAGVGLGRTASLVTTLPDGGSGWRVLAVEPALSFSARPPEADAVFGTDRLRVAVSVAVPDLPGASGRVDLEDLGATARVPLGATADVDRLPVVLTTALAERLGVRTGSSVDLDLAAVSRTVHARVAGTVRQVDGSGSTLAVAADLPTLTDLTVLGGPAVTDAAGSVPRVDEVWIATPDPGATRAVVERSLPTAGSVRTAASVSSAPVLDPAIDALAAVAGAGALLALVVFAGATVGGGASGPTSTPGPVRGVPAFRALGVVPRQVAAVRAAELGVPVVAAVLGGVAGGVLTVATTAAPFAIAAVSGSAGLVTAQPVALALGTVVLPVVVLLGSAVVVAFATTRAARAVRVEPAVARATRRAPSGAGADR